MHLETLRVLHISKKKVKLLDPNFYRGLGGVHLDTCQRWVWISHVSSADFDFGSHEFFSHLRSTHALDVYLGEQAYAFLLRLAAGLESEVLGETDIFGQIKDAWKKAEASVDASTHELGSWMSRLFEDTKEIRTRYLQNLGGSSYGTLVRKVIKDQLSPGPVFLVGAGSIAQSIAPFLVDSELWVWNRNPSRLCAFRQELECKLDPKKMRQIRFLGSSREEELQAWRNAAHAVVGIPLDSLQDYDRIQAWSEGGSEGRSVIHLGGRREVCQDWKTIPHFYALDDLFSLQNSLDHVRSVQIAHALRACEERAKLRTLGSSLSIPHGWEDLACFA